jgi:hypothetical protein
MTGLFIMAFAGKIGPRYFGAFLAIGGCQSNVPAVLAYQANNILTYSKRAVTSAVVIGFGGMGGIFAYVLSFFIDHGCFTFLACCPGGFIDCLPRS